MSDTSVASPSEEFSKLNSYNYDEQLSSSSSALRFPCQKNNQVRFSNAKNPSLCKLSPES